MKIYKKLILIALAPAFFIWLVGMYAARISESSLRAAIERTTATQSRAVMDEIDYVVHTRIAEWIAYAQSQIVQDALVQSNQAYAEKGNPTDYIAEIDQEWRQSKESPAQLNTLLRSTLSKELRGRIREFNAANGFPLYGEVFLTNRYGANAAQSHRTSDFRQNDEDWWNLAHEQGIHIGDVALDESTNIYSTDICLRIDDQDGNFLGVLKAVLNIEEPIKILNRHANDEDSSLECTMSLFTSAGKLIHTTDNDENLSASTYAQRFDRLADVNRDAVHPTKRDGREQTLAAYAKSDGHAGFEGLGWSVLIEFSAEQVFSPVKRMRKNIYLLATVTTILPTLFGGLFAWSLSRRINLLTIATRAVRNGEFNAHVPQNGNDELTELGESFNHMATGLDEAHKELVNQAKVLDLRNQRLEEEMQERHKVEREREKLDKQLLASSRQAGMAEVATGVLHNVGNVLNSVNVTANILMEDLANDRIDKLCKASGILQDNTDNLGEFLTNDEQGKHFPIFLSEVSRALSTARDEQLEELRGLTDNIQHIKEIVRAQQSLASAGGISEPVNIEEIVERAIKINSPGLTRHAIEIERNFESLPPVTTDQHKLLQILINLIGNAKAAVCNSRVKDKRISLAIEQIDAAARITVVDNGIGIRDEHLREIFTHGFSTKPDGHGFGLHSCALAAQAVGGSLSVESDGPHQGASFTLTIPMKKEVEVPCNV